jgi:splicing factor 3A subunit 1
LSKKSAAIVEKTAGYVARNGPVFEGRKSILLSFAYKHSKHLFKIDRIREKERGNPKFSFLSQGDAYNAFYLWRLTEVREGRGTAVSAGRVGEAAQVEPEKPKGPEKPPDFHFSARMPNISAQDLDVVKLTALFVAANGRQFMTTLSQKETGNYQFDFLRPNHSMYQFFSRLVDQYTELLRSGGEGDRGKAEMQRMKELEQNINDKYHVLGRAKQRAAYLKYQEEQKQKKEEEAEQEKGKFIGLMVTYFLNHLTFFLVAYAQIDWHDFVIAETVLFTEADDAANLPAPTSLSDLQSASLEQKAMMSLQPHNMRIEEAMPGDDTYGSYEATTQQVQHIPQPIQPVYAPQLPRVVPQPDIPVASNTEEEDAIRERKLARESAQRAQAEALAAAKGGAAPMKIRSDYVPRAALNAQNRRSDQMAVCPNCKQKIPYNELDEHMRSKLFHDLYLFFNLA